MEPSWTSIITVNSGLQKDCQEIERSSTMLTLLSFGKLPKARDHHQFSSHRIEIKMRKKRRGKKEKLCIVPRMIPIL